jgi:hypothetical protein
VCQRGVFSAWWLYIVYQLMQLMQLYYLKVECSVSCLLTLSAATAQGVFMTQDSYAGGIEALEILQAQANGERATSSKLESSTHPNRQLQITVCHWYM